MFEATIIEDDVLVMCDVLVKQESGLIDIYEVKCTKEVNDAIMHDLAVQYYVCKKRFGDQLNSFNLVLNKSKLDEWSIHNYSETLEKFQPAVKDKIMQLKQVLINDEPDIVMGSHCDQPYECLFKEYCQKNKNN